MTVSGESGGRDRRWICFSWLFSERKRDGAGTVQENALGLFVGGRVPAGAFHRMCVGVEQELGAWLEGLLDLIWANLSPTSNIWATFSSDSWKTRQTKSKIGLWPSKMLADQGNWRRVYHEITQASVPAEIQRHSQWMCSSYFLDVAYIKLHLAYNAGFHMEIFRMFKVYKASSVWPIQTKCSAFHASIHLISIPTSVLLTSQTSTWTKSLTFFERPPLSRRRSLVFSLGCGASIRALTFASSESEMQALMLHKIEDNGEKNTVVMQDRKYRNDCSGCIGFTEVVTCDGKSSDWTN